MTMKDELPRSVGAQYATGEEWRNNSKQNEEMEPKLKQCPILDVTGDIRWQKGTSSFRFQTHFVPS